MIRLLGIFAICLALGACAGTPGHLSFSPASDVALASQGWVEGRSYAGFAPAGAHIEKALFCNSPRCGGPGFVVVATKTMSAGNEQGFRLAMSNPRLTDAKLLQALQIFAYGAPKFSDLDGRITSAHKQVDSMIMTFSFKKVLPKAGPMYASARANITASQIHIVVAGGLTPAKARERLRLARD